MITDYHTREISMNERSQFDSKYEEYHFPNGVVVYARSFPEAERLYEEILKNNN